MSKIEQNKIKIIKPKQKRHQSLLELKAQATDLRESIVRQKKQAEDQLYQKKSIDAKQERMRHKQHEYLMKKLKEIDVEQNRKKAEKIKQSQNITASKMKQFMSSRVSISKGNYQNRLHKTIKDRDRAEQTFQKLRDEQERLLSMVKSSEKTMLTSLYSLITINPQKRSRKGSFARESEASQNEVDNYEKQEFQT